jgi:hypothetical protein
MLPNSPIPQTTGSSMTDPAMLFSTEIWPWVTGSLTLGVIAGSLCALVR